MGRGGGGGRPRVNPRDYDHYRETPAPSSTPISSAGTSPDGTAFDEKERPDGKVNIYFNRGKVDGGNHGHVVEIRHDDGNRTYDHVHDVSQTPYIDKPTKRS